ncbi:MAG: transcriptional regulator [Thermofilum sp.]|nr:transcriptional regulator [Thermofilum sp.]
MEVPLKPIGKEETRKLELALIFGTLMRQDVLEKIKNSEDKITWLDSLVIASGALARERAGIPVARIAEELGRTETTIRNHLTGRTEAGKIVRETYELLVRNSGRLEFLMPSGEEIEKLRRENEELRKKIDNIKQALQSILYSL